MAFFIPARKLLAVQMVWENLSISQTVVLSSNDVKNDGKRSWYNQFKKVTEFWATS